jgi:hypothetical protein
MAYDRRPGGTECHSLSSAHPSNSACGTASMARVMDPRLREADGAAGALDG